MKALGVTGCEKPKNLHFTVRAPRASLFGEVFTRANGLGVSSTPTSPSDEIRDTALRAPLEREADRVAQLVTGSGSRKRDEPLGTAAWMTRGSGLAPSVRGEGRPLDAATRDYFEPRIGFDLSAVRVHSGPAATASARSAGARAYTAGADIVFGKDRYAPATGEGRRLLAHELTHVLHQATADPGGARVDSARSGLPISVGAVPGAGIQLAPEDEPDCRVDETVLSYADGSRQPRCVTEDDPEFQANYVDNNIVQATGLAVAGTTWENIDHDRVPVMHLTYKDGRTLLLEVADIRYQPRTVAGPPLGARQMRVMSFPSYEMRSDGFVYPVRFPPTGTYVDWSYASNIMSLRGGLYDSIEELKRLMTLMELGAFFGSQIAALGGQASLTSAAIKSGGLFQPMPKHPRKDTATPTPRPTPSAPKPWKLLSFKLRRLTSDDAPVKVARRASKGDDQPKTVYEVKKLSSDPDTQSEVRMAEHLADDGHEVHFNANDTRGDLTVDGVGTDVKHLSKPGGVASAITRGTKQGEQVALDGTTIKLTEKDAEAGIAAFRQEIAKRPNKLGTLKRVYVLLGDGKVMVHHFDGTQLKVERIGAGGTGEPR